MNRPPPQRGGFPDADGIGGRPQGSPLRVSRNFPASPPHFPRRGGSRGRPCISKNRRGDSGIARCRKAVIFPMPLASVGDRKGRPYAFSRNSPHARRILRVGAIHESPAAAARRFSRCRWHRWATARVAPTRFPGISLHPRCIFRVEAALAAAPLHVKTVGAIHESPADLR